MDEIDKMLAEHRKTLRAAIEVAGLGMGQKGLILAIIDRHFEVQAAIAERLRVVERMARGVCQPM